MSILESHNKEINMSNYFVVHGSFGDPFENWFPWLKNELSSRNLECIVPQFPSPEHQNYENWERLLDYYRSLGLVRPATVFVAHSSGATFVTKYIVENAIKIKGFVSVSGFNNFFAGSEDFDSINSPFFMKESEIAKFMSFCPSRHSFISDDDPYLPQEVLKGYSEAIESQLYILSDAGHINSEAGYDEFPELLEVLLSI